MACSVPPSATLPARTLERRTKPLASSARPSVSGGQSWRFSLEWPRRASGCRSALQARAGPVVQGDGGLQVEQVGGALEETRLDRVAVAHQAVAGAVQGVPAHGLAVDVDPRQGGRRAHGGDAGLHQLGGAALGLVLDRGGAGPALEGALGGEDALDAGAQRWPVPARQGDGAAEVAQGALAHPGAAADGADETLLAPGAGASGGLADEQAPMGAGSGTGVKKL